VKVLSALPNYCRNFSSNHLRRVSVWNSSRLLSIPY